MKSRTRRRGRRRNRPHRCLSTLPFRTLTRAGPFGDAGICGGVRGGGGGCGAIGRSVTSVRVCVDEQGLTVRAVCRTVAFDST